MKKLLFIALGFGAFLLSSCEKDKTGNESSSVEKYYVCTSDIPRAVDFADINQSIRDHELLYSLAYIRGNHEYDTYATVDLFFDDEGWWYTYDNHHGDYRFKPDHQQAEVWHFLNSNTVKVAYADLASPSVKDATILVRINVPSPLGNLVMAAPSYNTTTYTYQKLDNKIIVTDGTIFTVIDDETLLKDGSSKRLTQYDPQQSF